MGEVAPATGTHAESSGSPLVDPEDRNPQEILN